MHIVVKYDCLLLTFFFQIISIYFYFSAQPGDSSDLHPLREIASVIMTSSGFISETREVNYLGFELFKKLYEN